MTRQEKWDRRFIEMARMIASWSKDPSTKVGCVIVDPRTNTIVATGYNGLPREVHDQAYRMQMRPEKYEWTEHAERNAVFEAARRGVALEGMTAYLNWEPRPCSDCARGLIQAGVKRVVGPNLPFGGKGDWDFSVSDEMMQEAGVVQEIVAE